MAKIFIEFRIKKWVKYTTHCEKPIKTDIFAFGINSCSYLTFRSNPTFISNHTNNYETKVETILTNGNYDLFLFIKPFVP